MFEWNTKSPAHIGQFRRVDPPLSARKLDCARERLLWYGDVVDFAAPTEHSLVERCIMCSKKIRSLDQGADLRPKVPECRRVPYVFPGQPVDVGEVEVRRWWSNQESLLGHDATAVHQH